MVNTLIFDFDGVIINSLEVQRTAFYESYNLVVGDGRTPSFEEFVSHSGDSIQNIFKKMNLPLEMVQPYREFSRKRINRIKVYNGMKELLGMLNQEGYSCGLCTGKDRERTLEILKLIDCCYFFRTVVCSDDVKNPKPHPQSLIAAIENLNSKPCKSVMIGDAKNDIICAKKAGVTSIAVSWGDVCRKALEEQKPDFIVDSVEDLYKCIKKLSYLPVTL